MKKVTGLTGLDQVIVFFYLAALVPMNNALLSTEDNATDTISSSTLLYGANFALLALAVFLLIWVRVVSRKNAIAE